ncbi:plastid-lipid associated protein PAP [Actinidia rufa]|uniref:Plastid-lipid associated protein PAP n=1 Tax=Actinidia rufa TaxID=165716 RepID=A0A7J0E3S6_9ERIC|nr:plastid-lipid associated protein PAP [Actinidia rufa]
MPNSYSHPLVPHRPIPLRQIPPPRPRRRPGPRPQDSERPLEALAKIVEAIDAMADLGRDNVTTDQSLSATWRLLWTTEKEQLFIIKNAFLFGTRAGDVLQVIDVEKGLLNNVITFPPHGVFFVRSTIEIASTQRVNFKYYQGCRQGNRSVQDYDFEFNRLSGRNALTETEGQLVSRFVGGLRQDIQDLVSLHPVSTLNMAIQLAKRAELQLNRHHPAFVRTHNTTPHPEQDKGKTAT